MRRILVNIVVLCLSVILTILSTIVVLEVILRMTQAPSVSPGYVKTSPTRRYELKPGFKGTTYKASFFVNSMGLRDFERDPSPEAYRIALVGDSVTFGIGVDLDQTFTKLLEKKLNDEPGRTRKVQVFNLGVPSYNTVQEFVYLREIYDKLMPDMVIIEFSAQNDTKKVELGLKKHGRMVMLWKDILRNMYSYDYLANKYYTFKYNSEAARFVDGYAQRYYYDNMQYRDDYEGWIEAKHVFVELKRFCDARGITLVFAIGGNSFKIAPTPEEDILYPIMLKVKGALRDAEIDHVIVFDDAFRPYSGKEYIFMVTPTDGHPSAVSHRIIAHTLFDYLNRSSLVPQN